MPVFSHVLILKNGRVLAAGKKLAMLNIKLLSTAFAARLKLRKVRGRCTIMVAPKLGVVI